MLLIFTDYLLLLISLKLDAEFRRFTINPNKVGTYEDFYAFLERMHHLGDVPFLVGYTDPQGDLLPINNDDNYLKALTSSKPPLKIVLQKRGSCRRFKFCICRAEVPNSTCSYFQYFKL